MPWRLKFFKPSLNLQFVYFSAVFGLIPFSSLEYKLIEIDFCYKLPYDYLLKNCTDESAVPRKLEIGRYLFLIESSAFECSRKNWFWFGWAVEVWNNASKICLMHGNWVLLACLTSVLSKSGCTDTQQTAQSAREAQSTSERQEASKDPSLFNLYWHTHWQVHAPCAQRLPRYWLHPALFYGC